jgi:hypothetical protein
MTTHRTRHRARCLVVLALATVFVASSCGSDPGSGDDGSPKPSSGAASESGSVSTPKEEKSGNACDIVSDDVAADVLGVKIVRREPHEKPGSITCIKGSKRSNDLGTNSFVNVNEFTGRGAAQLAEQAAAEEGSKRVSGLGDRAYFLPNAGALFVVGGDDVVNVQVVKAGKPGNQHDCVTVMKDVLSRR